MNWHDHIHTDPAVLLGKPIVEGTRLCVPIDGHVWYSSIRYGALRYTEPRKW